MNLGDAVVLLLISLVLFGGLLRGRDVYAAFLDGAGEGIHMMFKLIPSFVGLIVAVEMLNSSGLMQALADVISPFTKQILLPAELVPMMLLRPVSGSASNAIMINLFSRFGPDSYIGRLASVISGSTETTFYAVTVYYGSCGIRKLRHTLLAALVADFTAMAVSLLAVNLIF